MRYHGALPRYCRPSLDIRRQIHNLIMQDAALPQHGLDVLQRLRDVHLRGVDGEFDGFRSSDPDTCCRIRKVEPLARALAPFRAWINGRKRFQGAARAALPVVEADGERLKFNPFANVDAEDIRLIYAAADLPPHPLVASGFASVGCMPCTSRTAPDEDPRAGRWRGRNKTECGIHVPTVGVAP